MVRAPLSILLPASVLMALVLASEPAHAVTGSGVLQARQGVSALLRGQYERAVAAYTEALEDRNLSDPRRANIYNDRGVAKWRLGRAREAIEDFNEAVMLFPSYSVVYNNRGNALMDLGRPDEAIADFDRAIAIAPGYGAAYNNRGNAHHAIGNFKAAERDFRKAASLMPTNAVPFNGRGRVHVVAGRHYAAVRDFNRAITLNANYYSAHRNRAQALAALDAHDDAVADLNELITQRPEETELYLERARAYVETRKYNSAFRDFDKAIKLSPDLIEAYLERAELHLTLKRYKSAVADLTTAIERSAERGNLADIYADRALAQLEMGEAEEALSDASKALQLQPAHQEARLARAKIYDAVGRAADALADYGAVYLRNPAQPEARAALAASGEELPELRQAQPEPLGEPVKGWQVLREDGKYFATNTSYPKLRVPLEMYGTGEPRVIDWNLLKYQLRGIGLLEYFAGELTEDGGKPLEYVAIVDLSKRKVVAIEPDAWGEAKAKWDWQQASVVVTDPEGTANEIKLRTAAAAPVDTNRNSGWWSDGYWRDQQPVPRPRSRTKRRRQQRGILDWLFR